MTAVEPTLIPVLTVDGPSGAGKGTVSRALARILGWHFLDSGALYRLTAYAALQRGLALEADSGLADLAADLDVHFDADSERIWLGEEEVSRAIRSEEVGNAASQVAALPEVRQALLALQRDCRRRPGLVADGRDMGTVVFPGAELKIFLTASAEERAHRRYNQLKEKGIEADIEALIEAIAERDRRDMSRATAPLRAADDAMILDTSDKDIPASIAAAEALARKVFG